MNPPQITPAAAALCRDCAMDWPQAAPICPACGGARRLAHPELAALTYAHLDCDAFYASIEKRDDPSLSGRAVIVGGGRRGVVAAACYVARAHGVRSAMPMFKALRLCPQAAVIKPDMAKYVAAGRAVRALMQEAAPLVEPVSIDEAYLDLAGCAAINQGVPARALVRLQRRIELEVGVTASVGVSFNRFLAKTASELDKPRGFAVIGRAGVAAFLAPRPVGGLPGVGPAGAKALARLDIHTIADLAAADRRHLTARFGAFGATLWGFAQGEDHRPVDPDSERRSLSAETTFETDLADPAALDDRLWLLCERLAARARAAGCAGRSLALKLKTADFRTLSRRRALPAPTLLPARIHAAASALLVAEADGRRAFRLIGVGFLDLVDAAEADAGDLIDAAAPRRAAAEGAAEALRARFGAAALQSGRTLKIKALRKTPNGQSGQSE